MNRTTAENVSHRLTATRNALMSVSVLALTAILTAQPARAANECGAEGVGADTVTCTGASFANGITYAGSDGLSLVLDNAAMTVTRGGATDGVNLSGTTANDLTVTAASLTSIDGGTGGTAILVNNGGDGKAAIVLNGGTFTADFFQHGAIEAVHNSGAGDSVITMNAGQVTNTGASRYGLHALIAGSATGNATILMKDGTVTSPTALRAAISNAAAPGTATATLDGGAINGAVLATTSGSGLAQVFINGGTITAGGSGTAARADASTGTGNAAVSMTGGTLTGGNPFASAGLLASSNGGSAQASISGGSVTTIATSGYALYANSTTGLATVTMTGGTVVTNAASASGLRAQVTNAASNTDASVIFSGGSITNNSNSTVGLYAQTAGSGAATIQLLGGASGTGGTITSVTGAQSLAVSGLSSIRMEAGAITATNQGLSASSTTGDAMVTVTGGTISTTANNGHGANAFTGTGAGTITATMSGGSITTNGSLAIGLRSAAFNGAAVVRMTGGTITAGGTGADGILATNLTGAGSYDISVTGGTVTGGGASSAAVHGYSLAGGTITIGAGATLNAGTSGVALSSTGLNAGAATVTTAGTLNGGIELDEIVVNRLSITGGTIAGNINGGGNAILNFDLGASGSFRYDAAYAITGVTSATFNSGSVTIDGVLNTGSLTANGGALSLTSDLTTGAVTVNGGTVQIGGNLTGTDFAINSGTVRIGGNVASTTFAINGGSVSISGSVTPGAAVTNAGQLTVNGALNSGLTVASGGRLSGNGTVGATTAQSGAIVAPGNSIGTLHINGAFTQAAGSIYQVEVDPTSSASDLIQVNGAATLQSGAVLNVVKNPVGEYQLGTVYRVLTASGGLTGTYTVTGETTGVSAFLGLRDSYDANNAYLTVVQTQPLTNAATTPNQQAVAGALPPSGPLTTAILNSPDLPTAQSAFNQLSASAQASAKGALVANGLYVRDVTFDRLRDAFCDQENTSSSARPGCSAEGPSLWAQGFGGWGGVSGNANAAGLNHSTAGFLVGFDVPVADWRLGMFGGRSQSDLHLVGMDATGESTDFHLGAYAVTRWDNISLRLGASYSWDGITANRSVAFANFSDQLRSVYNAGTSQGFAELGYRMEMWETMFEPFANLAYVNVRTDGFREVGGPAALTVRADTLENLVSTLGVRPSTTLDWEGADITLRGLAGWRHTFGTVAPRSTMAFAGGSDFTVTGAPVGRDAVVLEAGGDFGLTDNISAGLAYGTQLSSHTTAQTLRGTIRVAF